MKNTYDILVNFKKRAYEFYEWDKTDEIKHIKSIPTFKVEDNCLLDFCNNNLKVDREFLKKIENKTEVFCKGKVKTLNYACILFCLKKAMAFLFDDEGVLIGKSNLLFDEADDIISSFYEDSEIIIDYNIISSCLENKNYTRSENQKINLLLKYLNNMYEEKKVYEIKYMYFECFDKKIEDEEEAYKNIIFEIKNYNFSIVKKLISLIKVLKK